AAHGDADQCAGALDLHPDGALAARLGSRRRTGCVAVAAALIRRWAWPLAAVAAFAFLVGLALHGERRDPMQEFKPAGLLTAFAPEDAREIEIATGAETWRFRREDVWRAVDPPKPVPADVAQRIDLALRLLRNSAPLRAL